MKIMRDAKEATRRFEEIYQAKKGNPEYKEMLLLAFLINEYEKKLVPARCGSH